MENNKQNLTGFTEYLDLRHRYYIVVALEKENENNLIDCNFFDEKGEIKEGYEGFWFDEKMFLLMESYFFNHIDSECDLLINMYEEEFAFPEVLPKVLDVVDRSLVECDNQEVIELGNKLKKLIEKAIEINTFVGFCF